MFGICAEPRFSLEFQPFAVAVLKRLADYDTTRPKNHPYAFHLHAQRVASDMQDLSVAMRQDDDMQDALYWASLLHDCGKRMLPVAIWDVDGKPSEAIRSQRRGHTDQGVAIINAGFGAEDDHPFLELVRDLAAHHHEAMDGSGWKGLSGDRLSLPARMLCVCDAFDGYSSWRPHFGKRDISIKGVLQRMQGEKTSQFDAEILAVFAEMKLRAQS